MEREAMKGLWNVTTKARSLLCTQDCNVKIVI